MDKTFTWWTTIVLLFGVLEAFRGSLAATAKLQTAAKIRSGVITLDFMASGLQAGSRFSSY